MPARTQLEFLKLVVRNLPPALSAEDFRAACEEEFGDRITWSCFNQGKSSAKTTRYSTGYVRVKSEVDIPEFKVALEGHRFPGRRGGEPAVAVEYAPFQRVPTSKVKRDPKEGTIEQDVAFQEFQAALERGVEPLPSAALAEPEEPGEAAKAPVVTPLMAHLTDTTAADPKPPPPLRAARKQKESPPMKKGGGAAAAAAARDTTSSKGWTLKDKGPSGSVTGKGGKGKEEGAPVKRIKASKQASAASAAAAAAAAMATPSHRSSGGSAADGTASDQASGNRVSGSGAAASSAERPAAVPPKSQRGRGKSTSSSAAQAAMATAAASLRPTSFHAAHPESSEAPAAGAEGRSAAQAARQAARAALAASREQPAPAPPPPPAPEASAQQPAKVRDKAAKKTRVRPGYGAWRPSRGSGGGGGSDALAADP